jgi:catechol 2,3-dioxygenase-like lactoylglutathione lyase family enzyme
MLPFKALIAENLLTTYSCPHSQGMMLEGATSMMFERISAITLKVTDMARSVHFYNEILGLQLIYGGKHSAFTSLRTAGAQDAILNLEQGACSNGWGRIIFHVKDVDELWGYITAKGLDAPRPRDAGWGERYFHLHDPDGHELSFAKPLP